MFLYKNDRVEQSLDNEMTSALVANLDRVASLIKVIQNCRGEKSQALRDEALEALEEFVNRASKDAAHVDNGVRHTIANLNAASEMIEDATEGMHSRYSWKEKPARAKETAA